MRQKLIFTLGKPRRLCDIPGVGLIPTMLADIRIDQLTAQKRKRRLVVDLDVVKWIGEDFGRPYQASLDVFDQEQLHGPEQDAGDAEREPDHRYVTDKASFVRGWRKQAEISRIEIKW